MNSSDQEPFDDLMDAVCCDEGEAAAAAGIDAALARGATLAGTPDTPLFYAAQMRRAAVIRHLYKRGASLAGELEASKELCPQEYLAEGEVRAHTALHQAAEDGWLEGVELFLSIDPGVNVAVKAFDYINRTPLIAAAQNGHADVCRVLVAAGADVNHYDQRLAGDSALALAVDQGYAEVVRFLLSCGADIHAPGWMRITPLMRARDLPEEFRPVRAMMEEAAARQPRREG